MYIRPMIVYKTMEEENNNKKKNQHAISQLYILH